MSRSLKDVAAEVQRCAYAWEHDARIIGNVTAVELRLLIRERDALITRLRAAEAQTAWQPIETAPRDGTWVLAWCGTSCEQITWTDEDRWGTGEGWVRPTHWQPLPAAPEAP